MQDDDRGTLSKRELTGIGHREFAAVQILELSPFNFVIVPMLLTEVVDNVMPFTRACSPAPAGGRSPQRRPDIARARDLLDWKPCTLLETATYAPSGTLMSCCRTRNYGRSSLRSRRLKQRGTSVSSHSTARHLYRLAQPCIRVHFFSPATA